VALADRISALARRDTSEVRYSADTYLGILQQAGTFGYGGQTYGYGHPGARLLQTLGGIRISEIANSLPGYAAAVNGCPPAFAAELVRTAVLSQLRFTFRNLPSTRTPRRQFGTTALAPLENPDTNVTTGEMLARMEWHAGLAGNAYVHRQPKRLFVMRPDWVGIVYGSQREPDDPGWALDRELLGYVYQNGGLFGGTNRPSTLLPNEVAHWAPEPDALMPGLGMSWLTPAIRDLQGDRAISEFKLQYWQNSATPNLVIKGLTAPDGRPLATKEQFDEIVEMLEARHAGVANAFRTLYLTGGADVMPVGANLNDLDLKSVQGQGETRIAMLSRVPAAILQIAEGLAGSSLNAGNFGQARRIFADTWVYPKAAGLCGALAAVIDVPRDAELWFDTADVLLLREDAKDAAEIEQVKAATITMYVREGFTADSAIAAVRGQDISLLQHTGLTSVQLQEPGAEAPSGGKAAGGPPAAVGDDPARGRAGQRRFDPGQPRDPHTGEWVGDVVGDVARAVFGGMHAATEQDRADFRAKVGKAIPPAWTDVHIADDLDSAKILARGRDSKGRGQTIYSAEHTESQAAVKFARVRELNRHLDKLDHAIERDVDTNDHAAALALIRRLGMRPGSDRDTGAKEKAHGATNLRARHVTVDGDVVGLDFVGKKGVHIQLTVRDPLIARALSMRLATRSGDMPLFDTDEDRTRAYMQSTGVPREFLLKDLRTVHANVVALREIAVRGEEKPRSRMEFRRWRREVAEAVSSELGNTPVLALASYINPTVFDPWVQSEDWL
jgi:DNA topoisomerase IB